MSTLASATDAPRRIASANLCADELLLTLADADQIVSLSPFSTDPEMSFLHEKAKAFPVNRGVGEDIVRLKADLVLVGPYDSRYTRDLLTAQGIRFLSLTPWDNIEDGRKQIRQLAALFGHPERGEALVHEMNGALDSIKGRASKDGRAPSSLVLHRRGYVFHAGVTGEVAKLAGFRDVSAALGVGQAGFVRLERLLVDPPDFLLVSQNSVLAGDQGQALLVHPALLESFPLERRLVLPDQLTICGGPSTIALVHALAGEIDAKVLR